MKVPIEFEDYDPQDPDLEFRKNRWNYWNVLKDVRAEYITNVDALAGQFDADDFGICLAKALGYDTAELFNFMHDKEQYFWNNFQAMQSTSTHPPYDQRIQRAKKSGFKLSKGGQQQINALQQHLA